MKKEVFTQEFEKCFTVFQQVQLMKKYIDELLQQEIPEIDISGKVDKTTTFTDPNGNPYEGETGWVVDDDKLFYETKIRSTQPGVYDYSAYFYMGEDSIYLDNNHINLAMDDNVFYVNCEVDEGYYINGRVETNGQSSVGITAGNNTLKVTSDNGLLYNDVQVGLYTQYLKVNINDDNDIMRTFTIILNTFKPITTLDEFRDYIRNRLIYSDTPTYITTTIHFMELGTLSPIYLVFSCGYYGTPSCTVQELTTSDNTIVNVLLSTNISVVLGRMTDFEVLTTIKG